MSGYGISIFVGEKMSKRPLAIFTTIFAAGVTAGSYINNWLFISILLVLILLIFLSVISKTRKHLIYAALIFAFLLGTVSCLFTLSKFSKTDFINLKDCEVSFQARVVSEPDIRDKKTVYQIIPIQVNDNTSCNSKILLTIYKKDNSEPVFSYGGIITGTGKVVLPSKARNPGGFDYRRYLNSQGIYASIICFSGKVSYSGISDINPLINGAILLKKKIENIIDQSLPPNQAGLLKGMLIGERNGLPESIRNDFNISGLTHIICVSGANIGYVALTTIFFLGILKVKKPLANLITIFILMVFMIITGCSPSVVRATIMGIMILLAEVFGRKSDIYTSISAACLIILIYNPLTLYDIGFQLSFAGTTGIVLFYRTLSNVFQVLPKIINEALSSTIAAQIVVSPIIAVYFNKLSLIALISNIFVIPLTGIITSLGFASVILGQFSTFLAGSALNLVYLPLTLIIWIAEVSAKIPYASILVPTPGIAFLIVFYGIVFTLLWYMPRKNKASKLFGYIPAACELTALLSILLMLIPQPFRVFFVDVGQGDCILIKNTSGQTCLIDGGGTYPGSFSSFKPENTVIPFILDNGTATIDMAILSHPHGDHIEGLIKVVENLYVKCLVIGPQYENTPDMENLLKLCRIKNTQVIQVSQKDQIHFGSAEFTVLHPAKTINTYQDSPLNNNSLVIKLEYLGTKILFTGDIQSEAEKVILDSGQDIHANILKTAHHGSLYSTTPDFLKSVSPSSAVISVGRNNFGHPADPVLQRLKQYGVKVLRTDKNGCITVEINNKGYSIISSLED